MRPNRAHQRKLLSTTPATRKAILIKYMLVKIEIEDWHGVADVANDIRELESQHPNLKSSKQPG